MNHGHNYKDTLFKALWPLFYGLVALLIFWCKLSFQISEKSYEVLHLSSLSSHFIVFKMTQYCAIYTSWTFKKKLKWNFLLSTSSCSQSTAVTPSSTSAATRLSSSQVPTTPTTPSAATGTSPVTTPTTPAAPAPSAGASSPTQPIQLSDLQNILATMNVPAAGQGGKGCIRSWFLSPLLSMRITNAVKVLTLPTLLKLWVMF